VKVLVTGANGFLGQAIVRRLLEEGWQVRALLRPGRTVDFPEVEVVCGDLCDEASIRRAMDGVDAVVHAGARVTTTGKWEEFAETNIRGTRRVIHAARAAGVRRVVHISSLSVYDVPTDDVKITEDSAYESEANGRGHYSRSKLAADRLALWEAQRGAPVVVLRPGLLYGPGKRPPLARQSFDAGRWKLLLARRDYPLPYSHVDNVSEAVMRALSAPDSVAAQAFTIVDANLPQHEVVNEFRALAGESWSPVYLPVGLVATLAWCAERALRLARRRSPVTYHQIRRATNRATYDCSRAQQLLGWQPRIDVHSGLAGAFAALSKPQGHDIENKAA
jgi:nucleoside-diphosphate-sugar epimerase